MRKSVQIVEIKEERSGQRLDNWLFNMVKGVPKSRIYRAIRKGEVRINGKRIKAEYKLCAGDKLRIPPLRVNAIVKPIIKETTRTWLLSRILYEDDDLLVINKPAGLAVHGGSKMDFGIIDILRQARANDTLELVHRLDKDTSGCLMIAKDRLALQQLHTLLREAKIDKEYLCLVKGSWQEKQRLVELPLRKNVLHSGERLVQADAHGKMAVTEFNLIRSTFQASLIRAKLYTGRTHQIRVHLQQIEHPIAGDGKYGDRIFNKKMYALGLKRLFLHAEKLKFSLPGADQVITVTAPLEEDLQQCWNQIKKTNSNTN